jgi:hypothetical protein
VQEPVVSINSNSVTVQCNFLPGSTSIGCFVLIDGLGNSTITLILQRRHGSNTTFQELMVTNGVEGDVELVVMVFDLRRDGTIGDLPVPASIVDARGAVTEGA